MAVGQLRSHKGYKCSLFHGNCDHEDRKVLPNVGTKRCIESAHLILKITGRL